MLIADTDLRALSVFRAVAEHRSFVGAQVALGLSQSAVSFHVKALEERLGFTLCRRGRGGFELTDRGAIVYEQSKLLAQSLTAFATTVSKLRNRVAGVMRLGIVDNTITDDELPIFRIIGTLHRKAPDARVQLSIDAPEVLLSELASGALDIAILPETRTYPGLRFRPLKEEEHRLYCAASHPLFELGDNDISIERIAEQLFVVRAYANLNELAAFPGANAGAKVSNIEAQAMFILSGCYIGFLPVHFASRWCDAGRMKPLRATEVSLASRFFVASKSGRRQNQVSELFIQQLVAQASERLHGKRRSGSDQPKGLTAKPISMGAPPSSQVSRSSPGKHQHVPADRVAVTNARMCVLDASRGVVVVRRSTSLAAVPHRAPASSVVRRDRAIGPDVQVARVLASAFAATNAS